MDFIYAFLQLTFITLLGPLMLFIACLVLWVKTRTWVTALMAVCQALFLALALAMVLRYRMEWIFEGGSPGTGEGLTRLNLINFGSVMLSIIFGALFLLFAASSVKALSAKALSAKALSAKALLPKPGVMVRNQAV